MFHVEHSKTNTKITLVFFEVSKIALNTFKTICVIPFHLAGMKARISDNTRAIITQCSLINSIIILSYL
jgi:hypothetical protein